MRWVDFLIQVLQAHGRSLQNLTSFFGEEELLELLEKVGEESENKTIPLQIKGEWFYSSATSPTPSRPQGFSPYEALEDSVRELGLSAVLEFYVWTYPYYRTMVELPIDLKDRLKIDTDIDLAELLVNEALKQAQQWIQSLPIPPQYRAQAERTAQAPWVRLRSEMLKKFGKRTMMQIT